MNKIKAKVVSLDKGLISYSDIRMIRLKSKTHTLLIMEDYLPIIGELNGMVEFVFEDNTETLTDIKGFYMHKNNEFHLLINDYEHMKEQIESQLVY